MSTILIVDDNAADSKLLHMLLQAKGHILLDAPTAEKALQLLRVHLPDLIVIDIYLPGMSGLQLVANMQADPGLAAIPKMFYTAWYDEADTRKAMRSYGYGVLAKPINVRETVGRIEEMLQQCRARP